MMRAYDRLPEAEADYNHSGDEGTFLFEARPLLDNDGADVAVEASLQSPEAATTPIPPPPSRSAPVTTGNDGVFANLSAKPEVSAAPEGKTYEELEPPSYAEVVQDPAPSYYETTVIANGIGEDGEVLIEGMPVGDFFTYFVNMLVSMSFDFIGFLLTAILATSHAARAGARSGFGITLIRYAFYLRTRDAQDDLKYYDPYDPDQQPEDDEKVVVESYWLSYFLMFVGFFILMRSIGDYIQARRLQAVILASSEAPPV
ncbi:hypothetical protein SpCBS45565_g02975 [Spizellomyces sp. 'palustris']|nr:hypothetical protein SpCBS45565_g02975 [Spizellomyces sp. 'palustris']